MPIFAQIGVDTIAKRNALLTAAEEKAKAATESGKTEAGRATDTTEAKAREVRGLAERVITLGKRGDLPARRRAMGFVYDKKVVEKVFGELGPRYASRPGGYSRMIKLGPRQGDGARMAQLELIVGEA